jgi:hypothetical protein
MKIARVRGLLGGCDIFFSAISRQVLPMLCCRRTLPLMAKKVAACMRPKRAC